MPDKRFYSIIFIGSSSQKWLSGVYWSLRTQTRTQFWIKTVWTLSCSHHKCVYTRQAETKTEPYQFHQPDGPCGFRDLHLGLSFLLCWGEAEPTCFSALCPLSNGNVQDVTVLKTCPQKFSGTMLKTATKWLAARLYWGYSGAGCGSLVWEDG